MSYEINHYVLQDATKLLNQSNLMIYMVITQAWR